MWRRCKFPWVNAIAHGYEQSHLIDDLSRLSTHASDHVKSMVLRAKTTRLGIHSHKVHDGKTILSSGREANSQPRDFSLAGETGYSQANPYVMHFCSRGYLDLVNKILDHRLNNTKAGKSEHERMIGYLEQPASWENIPNRILLLKFYGSFPPVSPTVPEALNHLATDLTLQRSEFLRIVNGHLKFSPGSLEDCVEAFDRSFSLQQKIESQDAKPWCDFEMYRSFPTQLAYIRHLRKQLIAFDH